MTQEYTYGSDFSGVGALEHAMEQIKQQSEIIPKMIYACDLDKFSRRSFLANHGTPEDLKILDTEVCKKIDSVYYREYNSEKKPTEQEWEFVRKFEHEVAKSFSFYYPWDVYQRQIPKKPLGLYVTSPPCQAFSIAGKRLGKEDKRGILFFNSYEFIKENQPETFLFENVKGLTSHDNNKTFQEWINYLGGKSVNGVPVIFPTEEALPYHIYYKVLNAKEHGIPQNRERIFIIGIREDVENKFSWPKEEHLQKRLKDILEPVVDEKYFLSEKNVDKLVHSKFNQEKSRLQQNDISDCILSRDYKDPKFVKIESNAPPEIQKVGFINQDTQASQVYGKEGIAPTISAGTHGYAMGYVELNSNTPPPNTDEVLIGDYRLDEGLRIRKDGNSPCLSARAREDGSGQPLILQRGRGHNKGGIHKECPPITSSSFEQNNLLMQPSSVLVVKQSRTEEGKELRRKNKKVSGKDTGKMNDREFVVKPQDFSDTILANANPQKEGIICVPVLTPDRPEKRQNGRRFKNDGDPSFTLTAQDRHGIYDGYKIRRLTPLECARLMDFPDSHTENCIKAGVSDSQLYKQAGNSIVRRVLTKTIVNIIPRK